MNLNANKIFGSLLGVVLADAVGARFEGVAAEQLRESFENKEAAFDYSLGRGHLRFTDDGQMTLALTEYLADEPTIIPDKLMHRFVDAYESWRGYGLGARVLIEAFRDRADYEFLAEHLFPGGSLGNGAAMRSVPVGLRFIGDTERIWNEAKASAWPTHRHELGIEGAQLIALAASFAASNETITPDGLASFLLCRCSTTVFRNRLERLANIRNEEDISAFGNGIEAHESVVTALACFALYPLSYREAVGTAIWQGGDTDTIAAMTGGLVGAHCGYPFIDSLPLERLEDGPSFVTYVRTTADRLGSKINPTST